MEDDDGNIKLITEKTIINMIIVNNEKKISNEHISIVMERYVDLIVTLNAPMMK